MGSGLAPLPLPEADLLADLLADAPPEAAPEGAGAPEEGAGAGALEAGGAGAELEPSPPSAASEKVKSIPSFEDERA